MSAPYSTMTSSSMLLTRRQNSFSTNSVGTIWGHKAEIMNSLCIISTMKSLLTTHLTYNCKSRERDRQMMKGHPSNSIHITLGEFYIHEQACWSSQTWTGQPFLQNSGDCTLSLPARSQMPLWAYCTPVRVDEHIQYNLHQVKKIKYLKERLIN